MQLSCQTRVRRRTCTLCGGHRGQAGGYKNLTNAERFPHSDVHREPSEVGFRHTLVTRLLILDILAGNLWKLDLMFWPLDSHDSLSFAHDIKFVCRQVRQRFLFPIRPEDLSPVETVMTAEPEVYAQIMLR